MNPTPCPLCGGTEGVGVRSNGAIVKCNACGQVYLTTKPPVEELEKHYQTYASNPGSHMKLPADAHEAALSHLRRQSFLDEVVSFTGAERRNLLDVGCGWGAFLDNARAHGFKVSGVEICREMADFARETLRLDCYQKQLERVPFKDGEFQVVTMIHSFEHLPNQQQALAFLHRIIEDRGYLCGIVPNFSSFCSRTMADAWPWLDPAMHYVHFTPESLTKALWANGFNMLRLYTATGDFDNTLLVNAVREHLDDNYQPAIDHLNKNNEGEEIRFWAQKI